MTGVRYCSRCQNHGKKVILKGHKRVCPRKSCNCEDCEFTSFRQSVMAGVLQRQRRQSDDVIHVDDVSGGNLVTRRHQDDDDVMGLSRPVKRRHESLCSDGGDISPLSSDSVGSRTYTEENFNNNNDNKNYVPNYKINDGNIQNYNIIESSKNMTIQGSPYMHYMDMYHRNEGLPLHVGDNGTIRSPPGISLSPPGMNKPDPPPSSPRPGSAPAVDDMSVISSIILRFCGNDPNKAVRCVEKAYQELFMVAYPDQSQGQLSPRIHQPPPRRPPLAPKPDLQATTSHTLNPSQRSLSQGFVVSQGPLMSPGSLGIGSQAPHGIQGPLQASHGLMRPAPIQGSQSPPMSQGSPILPQGPPLMPSGPGIQGGPLDAQSTIGLATLLTPNAPSYRLVWNPPNGVSPGSIVLGGPLDIDRNRNGNIQMPLPSSKPLIETVHHMPLNSYSMTGKDLHDIIAASVRDTGFVRSNTLNDSMIDHNV